MHIGNTSAIEPVIGADEVTQAADFFVERVVARAVHRRVHARQRALRLQVQQLVIEHVAVLQILIGPVTGQRHVDEPTAVELPGTEQETHLPDGGQQAMQEFIIAGRQPVLAAADDEPETGIDAAGSTTVTDALRCGIDIAGDLTMRPLILRQRFEGFARRLDESAVLRE